MQRRIQLMCAALGGALGFVVFGVLLWVGMNRHGRSWAGGPEFVVDLTIMSMSAVLGVVTWLAAARHERRIWQAAPTTWLNETKGVAIEVATQRLRVLSRNAGLIAAFSMLTFVFAVTSGVTGVGVFTDVQASVHFFAAFVALLAAPLSLVARRGWARRYRAVRETGWHATKSVSILRPYGRPLENPVITVEFEDRSVIELCTVVSTYGARHKEGQRTLGAWIGGTGSSMVVLFEHGLSRQGLYPVPVIALGARTVSQETPS